jgi:hypothetical protein
MTKKSFKDLIRDAGKNAAQQAREKKRKREEDATRPQIAAPGTKEGLTEPAAGTPDSTRQMTPLDKELALAQDEAAARKDKREKGKWETNPTMQMDALTEQAVLEQDQALADASTAPSPESKVLDDILESGAVEEEEVVVSTATEDLDQPLDGVVAEPPTLTNEKAMTEEEAAQIAEPPTMSKEAMTEQEAAQIAEPPTMSKEAMTEQEAAQIAEPPTITEKEKVDDSILREIEDDVFGAAAKTDDVFAPLAETGEDIFSALAETEVPAVAEGSQSVAVEESYQLLTEKVEKPERESELPSPAKTGRKGWLSYYLSEVFLGITSVAAAVTAAVYAGSLSVTMAAVLVGYMALSGTMAALSAMGKRRTRQQNEVSRGVNDEY